MDLGVLRDKIDCIDREIIRLFEERIQVAENVARYKIEQGKPVYDAERERTKIAKAKDMATTAFNAKGVETLFNQLMAISRIRQYEMVAEVQNENFGFHEVRLETKGARVVFQGVEGAYGHQAMLGYFGHEVDSYHVPTFEDVMKEVQDGHADYGVLPIENTSTGIITDVYDLMDKYDNYIVGEYVVKVEHALLGLRGTDINQIRTVYSHPQGLMQCSQFLDTKPEWEQVSLQNTAVSARKVVLEQDVTQAAIASPSAAAYYQLSVLKRHISDNDNNSTRFIIIKNKKEYEKNADSISITFEGAHETGSLYHILGFIIYNNLNMTKIESRPIQGEKWRYRFFIDLDGNLSEPAVRDALKGVEQETVNFKILGNYIKAE
jgi:chorismate mutase/prephenate dehydratase